MRADAENTTEGRELLMRMLEVFVLKFKTIAKIQLPSMITKTKQQQQHAPQQSASQNQTEIKMEQNETIDLCLTGQSVQKEDNKSKFGFPPASVYNVSDYRSLVKTLVCGVKTITWGVAACKVRQKRK